MYLKLIYYYKSTVHQFKKIKAKPKKPHLLYKLNLISSIERGKMGFFFFFDI